MNQTKIPETGWKNPMKRLYTPLLLALALMAAGCSGKHPVVQDHSPLTMLVSLGNGEKYYTALAKGLKEDLGIEVKLLAETAVDNSTLMLLDFANGCLPADIVFTSAKIPDEYLEGSCVDLLSKSHITDRFNYGRLKECTAPNGGIYQLPISSKLIGITYNATLMEEMGWKRPENFQDMLDLKRQCDQAGIPFACTCLLYSGHGFNDLFHLMGAQWLSTPDGAYWLKKFLQEGSVPVDEFQTQSRYFRRWVENGLFGQLVENSRTFGQQRALFLFTTSSDLKGYDGPMYDRNGRPTGRILHDQFKALPWISENGNNNCYTVYDNCWMALNASLLANGQQDRLARALQVLEYITQPKMADLVTGLSPDNYLSLTSFEIKDDRLYADYATQVKQGYLQPWYYNQFDQQTIVNTGIEVNSYLINSTRPANRRWLQETFYQANPKASYESVFEVLNNNNNNKLQRDILCTAQDTLGYEQTARLTAIAGALALQEAVDQSGMDARVQVALLPYIERRESLQPWRDVSVQNARMYPGPFETANVYVLVPYRCAETNAFRMNGAQIKAVVARRFHPARYFMDAVKTEVCNFDSTQYGPYPYACVCLNGLELQDDEEYLVSVPHNALEPSLYEQLEQKGKMLYNGKKPLTGNTVSGLQQYFALHPTVSSGNIEW